MEKKLTKKEVFGMLLEVKEVASNEIFVEFINHELELLDRKASKSTQTKTQVENENIKYDIMVALQEIDKPMTITDIQKNNEIMATYSNQKLSALLNQLVKEEKVNKIVDKKKSYFTVKKSV